MWSHQQRTSPLSGAAAKALDDRREIYKVQPIEPPFGAIFQHLGEFAPIPKQDAKDACIAFVTVRIEWLSIQNPRVLDDDWLKRKCRFSCEKFVRSGGSASGLKHADEGAKRPYHEEQKWIGIYQTF